MIELTILFTCFHHILDKTTASQLRIIVHSLLIMNGRITMLSISRWAGKGGSYRTIQRFFQKEIDWLLLNWALIKNLIEQDNDEVILIAGDTTTVSKTGKYTYGLGRFFSSLFSRRICGIAFQTLSIITVKSRRSWPILTEQLEPQPKEKRKNKTSKPKQKRKRGRPLGSKNKNRRDVELNAELTQIQKMLKRVLGLIKGTTNIVYFIYDGAFGNNVAVQMTRQVGLHIISKLRNNAALCFKYEGKQNQKGRRKVYGSRIDYQNIATKYLLYTEHSQNSYSRIYQCVALHSKFADLLNVVIIIKKDLVTGKEGRVILFSSDLELEGKKIVEYYRLRFQIEFNFRDAKQHWGLEDFMVTTKQSVLNFANLSLFMVNLSHILLRRSEEVSILDLKSRYHSLFYAKEILKLVLKTGHDIIIEPLFEKVPILGRIHKRKKVA